MRKERNNMKINIKRLIVLFILCGGCSGFLNATIDFASRSSTIVLRPDTQITYNNSFDMWDQQSIVRYGGYDRPISFYAGTSPLAYSETPTELIINNSTAIVGEAEHFKVENGGKLAVWGEITGNTSIVGLGFLNSPINLNGSTLNLLSGDLIFSSDTTIASNGYFHLNSYAMVLGGDLTIPNEVVITVTSSGIIDGKGHRLIFEGDAQLLLDTNVSLTLRNVVLAGIKDCGSQKTSLGSKRDWRSQLILQNAELQLARDYTFSQGQLYSYEDVVISGSNQFNYTTTNAFFVTPNSTLYLDLDTSFSYGPSINTDKDLIKMTDRTSRLYLNGCTLKSTCTGLQLTKGTLVIDHKNYLYNRDHHKGAGNLANGAANGITEAITFGDGTAANDLSIVILPGGKIDLVYGRLAYINAS